MTSRTPTETRLTIDTVQPHAVWEALQQAGTLTVDPTHPHWDPWDREAYEWMRAQMQARLPGYGGHWPWWGWAEPRVDLRRDAWLSPRGTALVRLRLTLPRAEVLLSAFDPWNVGPLAAGYVALSEAEWEAWECRKNARLLTWDARRDGSFEAFVQAETRCSWERIFDIETMRASAFWQTSAFHVQAVFETLRLSDVRDARPFTGRAHTKPTSP